MSPRRMVAAVAAMAALSGGIGIGIARAAAPEAPPSIPAAAPTDRASTRPSADPTPQPRSGQPGGRDRARQHRSLQQRAMHGEVTLRGKQHRVVVFQRGEVTAVSATALTVRSVDGFSASYRVTAETKIRHRRVQASIAQVAVGDRVRVRAVQSGSTAAATMIRERVR